MNDFSVGLGFMIMGFILSGSLAMIIVGMSYDAQLKMYLWDHDIEQLDEYEKLQYDVMYNTGKFLSVGGFVIFMCGFVFTLYTGYRTK